jgi:hypothetical protein
MSYTGPDRDFGEHDDYAIGDIVHTYDNTQGEVTFVRDDAYGRDYRVQEGGTERTYDGSRLALVQRRSAEVAR